MIRNHTLKLGREEFIYNNSILTQIEFESMAKKSVYEMEATATDFSKYIYSSLKVNNETFKYTYPDFLQLIHDEHDSGILLKLMMSMKDENESTDQQELSEEEKKN